MTPWTSNQREPYMTPAELLLLMLAGVALVIGVPW